MPPKRQQSSAALSPTLSPGAEAHVGGRGERAQKLTSQHINKSQEIASELVGAGRCVWALPAPDTGARGLLCQGIMSAMPEHGHSQPRWLQLRQRVPRTLAEPRLPSAFSVAHSDGFALQVTAGSTSPLPGVERFSPEPGKSSFAELQGGEKPLERIVLIAPLHGASHRAMSAATSAAREQSWLSQQGAGGLSAAVGRRPLRCCLPPSLPGHGCSRDTAAPARHRGGVACSTASVHKETDKCHGSPCKQAGRAGPISYMHCPAGPKATVLAPRLPQGFPCLQHRSPRRSHATAGARVTAGSP